jgi:hypothetical protein
MEMRMKMRATIRIFTVLSLFVSILRLHSPTFAKTVSALDPTKIGFQLLTNGLNQPVFVQMPAMGQDGCSLSKGPGAF